MRVCQQRLWSRKVPAAQPRSACVPQVSLRVCGQRSGRPAALLLQFGGGARGGRAAAGESASRQRVCRPRILRGRHPGPKVKTIPPCTALSTHSCTVSILFKGVLFGVVLLSICLLNYSFVYFYIDIDISILSLVILQTTWAQQEMCLCACLFSQAVPQLLCTGCLCCPAANSPNR